MTAWLPWPLRIAIFLFSGYSAVHALLRKRDPRAGFAWVALCLLVPGLGALFYWLFGVNRIRTRARKYLSEWQARASREVFVYGIAASPERIWEHIPEHYAPLLRASDRVTRRPLLPGNRLKSLHNGEAAYPEMLEAIAGAAESVYLSTYIFESNRAGQRFTEALLAAQQRGVDVRVLVDGFGQFYSRPRSRRLLAAAGVRHAVYLPFDLLRSQFHLNLRNHRKLLIVDGRTGFTGGMNIGDRHLVALPDNPTRVVDLHFRVEGPVVAEMTEAFLEDWTFTTGEPMPDVPFPEPLCCEPAFCRGVSAGPNEDFEKLQWIMLGAIDAAREHLRIMTPYFVPGREMISALCVTALSGVEVDVILPSVNNHRFVHWASRALHSELVEHGVRIWYQPPPFVHTKLLLVDDHYAQVGSANLDARSLQLNFEFNLEIYDAGLAGGLIGHFKEVLATCRPVTLEDLTSRPPHQHLVDAAARLFAPYL